MSLLRWVVGMVRHFFLGPDTEDMPFVVPEPIELKTLDELPPVPDDSGFYEKAAIAEAIEEAMAKSADRLRENSVNGRKDKVTKILNKLSS